MTWPDSPTGGPLGDGRFASATDRPETVDALRQAVDDRVAQGLRHLPPGGRHGARLRRHPRAPGVALDTRSLDRVIDYPAADMTITVEAGITLAALRAVLAGENQRLLVDAPRARPRHDRRRLSPPTRAAPAGSARAGRATRSSASASSRPTGPSSRGAGGSSRTSPATTSPGS